METVYLGCFRRSIFERVGLFDEGLVRNQDDELNDRIVAAGGRVWLSPHIRSTYLGRGSFRALWWQYYQYGYWKVRVLRQHPGGTTPASSGSSSPRCEPEQQRSLRLGAGSGDKG